MDTQAEVELATLKCLRCNHTWIPRVPKPRRCPNCLSPYWTTPKKSELKEVTVAAED